MTSINVNPPAPIGVQRQISLPLSKAVEIAYKNIRMRLSRSLLVTSGIVLALAFLMSILANDAIISSMRNWSAGAATTPEFDALRKEKSQLEAQLQPVEAKLQSAARKREKPAKEKTPVDAKKEFGKPLPELQKELERLPAQPQDLINAMTINPALVPEMSSWIDTQRKIVDLNNRLTSPEQLRSQMSSAGVPMTEQEIENNKIQTRWLLGLALLVAFVGILNAMLMSVTERFREIGTMKCLGALDSFIIKLFLLESLFQGVVGTVIGVILGLVLSLIAVLTSYGEFVWRDFPMNSILWGIVICLLVGVALTVAGAVYPAWQAARMQPIEAMRVEA